jgi:hypothetical protein
LVLGWLSIVAAVPDCDMARHSIEVTLGKLQITSVNWVDGTWIVVAESHGVEPPRRRAAARIA